MMAASLQCQGRDRHLSLFLSLSLFHFASAASSTPFPFSIYPIALTTPPTSLCPNPSPRLWRIRVVFREKNNQLTTREPALTVSGSIVPSVQRCDEKLDHRLCTSCYHLLPKKVEFKSSVSSSPQTAEPQ